MAEPTRQQIFGANSLEDVNTLTIAKSDLAAVGLTPSATNRAESLFVAVLLLAKNQLTSTNQSNNPEQNITIEDSFEQLTTRNNQAYRQKSITINLQKLDNNQAIDPDDY